MKAAYGYTRVSTAGQANQGVSLEAQEQAIKNWCTCNGYELKGILSDSGISGSKTEKNRPGLAKVLGELSKDDALIVYSLSRLSRSTKHTLEVSEKLEKVGADLVSITERIDTTGAAGRMVFRMLSVLAEFERELVIERTKCSLAYKKSQNKRTGSIPYGFKLDEDGKTLLPYEKEQEAVILIKKLRADGESLPAIGRELEARGLKPRNGGKWHPQTISNIARA